METEQANYPVARMAGLLGVDRRRFYEWVANKAAPPTSRAARMDTLVDSVIRLHAASDQTYGAPRIRADLAAEGWQVSEKTVAKAMRQAQIQGISPRTWHPPTTIQGARAYPIPDRVKRRFDMGGKDVAWFSDITYLSCGEGWAYLCAVRDGHTRRVLGRTVDKHMTADLVDATLRQAVALRGVLPGKVIFHADRGCQYTSQQIANTAAELDLLQSVGRTGVCWDNAAAESLWSTFKNEYYFRHVFVTLDHLRRATYVWIDSWYNARRRHSAIGYLSPLEYERRLVTDGEN